jgi:penicillin amidase
VDADLRKKLDMGPLPRSGNSYTVGQTGSGNNQSSGASFKIIVDTQDWNKAVGMNAPGQSGNPLSHNYRDLFEHWAKDKYFPVYYSREKIEAAADAVTILTSP